MVKVAKRPSNCLKKLCYRETNTLRGAKNLERQKKRGKKPDFECIDE